MTVLNPSVGELADRLFLLGIKVREGRAAGKPVAHFEAERAALEAALARKGWRDVESLDCLCLLSELRRLHEQMWPLVGRAEAGHQINSAELQRLNRRRSEVRSEIDRRAGEFRGEEKV